MSREVKLTKEGHERLKAALAQEQLRLQDATQILRQQMEAAEDQEDTGLEDAKREKLAIELRIDDLEDQLSRAVIIKAPKGNTVQLGMTVKLKEQTSGKSLEVVVVSGIEASILSAGMRKVSDDSPLGKELVGRKAGDSFVVNLERGKLKYKVVSINSK